MYTLIFHLEYFLRHFYLFESRVKDTTYAIYMNYTHINCKPNHKFKNIPGLTRLGVTYDVFMNIYIYIFHFFFLNAIPQLAFFWSTKCMLHKM